MPPSYAPQTHVGVATNWASAGLGPVAEGTYVPPSYAPHTHAGVATNWASAGLGPVAEGTYMPPSYAPQTHAGVSTNWASAGLGPVAEGTYTPPSYAPQTHAGFSTNWVSAGLGPVRHGYSDYIPNVYHSGYGYPTVSYPTSYHAPSTTSYGNVYGHHTGYLYNHAPAYVNLGAVTY